MAFGIKTLDIDNNGPAKSTGSVNWVNVYSVTYSGAITLNDGTNTHTINVVNQGGGNTDKTTIDVGGGASNTTAATRTAQAINAAQANGDILMTAVANGADVTVTHDNNGVNANAITSTESTSALTVSGMSGGSDDTGSPRFSPQSISTLTGRTDTTFKTIVIRNGTGVLKYSFESGVDASATEGSFGVLTTGQTKTLTFEEDDNVTDIYLHGVVQDVEIEFSYRVRK